MTYPCLPLPQAVQKANARRAATRARALTSPTCSEVEMASDRICAIDGCCKPARARGWCLGHYKRWRNHGDPLAGGRMRPNKGAVPEWVREHVSFKGDECLVWPFARDPNGYAVLNVGGRKRFAHRVMCEAAHGTSPSRHHYACHTCGKGHEGCVNPTHLRWGTPSENIADTVEHGTAYRGEACVAAKLTEADVQAIRLLDGRLPPEEIAQKFGVARRTISDVLARKTWAWLP